MQLKSVKLLTDQNGLNGFEPFLSSTLNYLSLFIVCTGGQWNALGVSAKSLCPLPGGPPKQMAFHPVDCRILPLELRGDKRRYSSRAIYALQVQCDSETLSDMEGQVFLKLELPGGFMFLIVFQIFVVLVLLAPSLHLLSPIAGVSKLQSGKTALYTNKVDHN